MPSEFKNIVKLGFLFCFVLLIFLTSTTLTNPDFNFPGLIESLFVFIAFSAICLLPNFNVTFHKKEKLFFALLGASIVVLFVRYLFGFSSQELSLTTKCGMMPGLFTKAECLLSLPFNQHHGLRIILFHLSALSIFLTTSILMKSFKNHRYILTTILTLPSLVWVYLSAAPAFNFPQFKMGADNFFVSGWGAERAGLLVSNPSWLWPLIGPTLSLVIPFIFYGRHYLKFYASFFVILTTIGFMSSQQRGAVLLLTLMCVFIALNVLLKMPFFRKRKYLFPGVGGLAVALFSLAFSFKEVIAKEIYKFLNLPFRPDLFHVSWERLEIWKIASDFMSKKPLLGYGHGSWLREFSKEAPSYIAYDTAHNHWVQMVFELGFLHAVAILIIFVLYFLLYINAKLSRAIMRKWHSDYSL